MLIVLSFQLTDALAYAFVSATTPTLLVQACTLCFPHVSSAIEHETSSLLAALQIAVESGYAQVNFESD
jgi:hypothetical protein